MWFFCWFELKWIFFVFGVWLVYSGICVGFPGIYGRWWVFDFVGKRCQLRRLWKVKFFFFFWLIGVSVTSRYSTACLLLAFNSDFFLSFGGEGFAISINSFLLGFDCFEWFSDSNWDFFFLTFHGSIPQLLLMSLRKSSYLWLCEISLRSLFFGDHHPFGFKTSYFSDCG